MSEAKTELPRGWEWTKLRDIISSTKGKKPKHLGPKNSNLTIPYVTIKVFEKGIIDKFTDGAGCEFCTKDDILMVWDGARSGLVGTGVEGAVGSTLVKLDTNGISKPLMYFFLQSKFEYINTRPKGVGIPHVNPNVLWNIDFPLPPLPEQHRIVAKIEELYTSLDAGIEELKNIQEHLKRYRKSVLKAAAEGKLTEEWREAHRDELEPVSVLLERIREERKKKLGKKNKELPPVDTSALPELPEGWEWATVEQLAASEERSIQSGPFGSNLLHSEFQDTGILAIGIDNVLEGKFSIGKQHRISPEKYEQLSKYKARPLDVLITVMATVGRCCVVPPHIETAIITKHVYRITGNRQIINPYYLMYCLWGGVQVRSQIFGNVRGQTRPGINGKILKRIGIPVSSIMEQEKIIEEIENKLSIGDKMQKVVEKNLMRAERLRQSILKRAFEGKLAPQDPNDEPASVLLKRIKEEKTTREAETKFKRKKATKKRGTKRAGKGKMGLYEILKASKEPLTPNELLKISKLSVEDFYEQLNKGIKNRAIVERRTNKKVFLEVGDENR